MAYYYDPYYGKGKKMSITNAQRSSTFTNGVVNHAESDHVYYNIEIANPLNVSGTDNLPIQATFSITSTQPILQNPSNFWLSIIRFSVTGALIPLFIMKVVTGQANPNLTPYIVCLSYNGNDYPQNIIYVPRNTQPIPQPPLISQTITPYYYVYSYQHMLDMINAAFVVSFAALKIANPGAPPTAPPALFYDPATQLISLICQSAYSPFINPLTVQIFMNGNLANTYLSGFDTILYGTNQLNGKDQQFFIGEWYNNGFPSTSIASYQFYTPDGVVPTWFQITQPYNTLQYWSSFRNLVFTTSMPISYEWIPSNNTVGNQSYGQATNSPILTDFEPDVTSAGAARSQLQYAVNSPYRFVDMNSSNPLSKIDINIYWEDVDANKYPIMIPTNQKCSVKIVFVRKPID